MNKNIIDRALSRFYTRDAPCDLSGYLLQDGLFMDLVDKQDADRGAWYRNDHRHISVCYNKQTDCFSAMIKFIALGNIRYMPECNGFDFIKKPSEAQARAIREYCSDLNEIYFCRIDKNGTPIWHSNDFYEFIEYISALRR